MHTVPAGYLSAFADTKAGTIESHVWRFERGSPDTPKLLAVRNVCVVRDIYAVQDEAGRPDRVIERTLLKLIDDDFCTARDRILDALRSGATINECDPWKAISMFIAFQLARTPRSFQVLRDEFASQKVEHADDDLPKLMVYIGEILDHWLSLMQWALWNIEGDDLLLTSDNPAATWAASESGAELGIGFSDPRLLISLPLSPRVCFVANQTEQSVSHVRRCTSARWKANEGPAVREIGHYKAPTKAAHDLNRVILKNGERYVFSSYVDRRLSRFLTNNFGAGDGLVRRRDRKPIGSTPL
jgi:hypothetical protein